MSAGKEGKVVKRKFVAEVGELTHGASKKFRIRSGDRELEALLVNYGGALFAYRNRCPHVGITLDWVDNQFFSVDRRYLMCANHGAVFEPKTGECIWGPCAGLSLQSVSLEVEGKRIFARCPDAED
jgi:nitrite reductase/ring-hydroxylating ferredoxin subunit